MGTSSELLVRLLVSRTLFSQSKWCAKPIPPPFAWKLVKPNEGHTGQTK
jgi:hypothetical protein